MQSSKRTLSSTSLDKDLGGKFLKPRDPTDLFERMRPLELSDLVEPKHQSGKRTGPSTNRKGRGAKERETLNRRNYTNANAQKDLNDHFAMKMNTVDEFRDAFTVVGTVGPVSSPPRVIEVETAGIRDVIHESVRIAQSKVKADFFTPEFEPALCHVAAHLNASKLQHAHRGSATGSSLYDEVPANLQLNEHVRMVATTTFIGVAGYLESIGRFDDNGSRFTPYLRSLVRNDDIGSWHPEHCMYHHMPQMYTAAYRQTFVDEPTTEEQRNVMRGLRALPPDPPRNIITDLAIVQDHMERLGQKFPKCVRSIDVSSGVGSRVQLVAYRPPDAFEPTRVWSPLELEALDLYVGATFGFCRDKDGLPLPPELHPRLISRQIHTSLGGVSAWINNLMSRG